MNEGSYTKESCPDHWNVNQFKAAVEMKVVQYLLYQETYRFLAGWLNKHANIVVDVIIYIILARLDRKSGSLAKQTLTRALIREANTHFNY